MCSDNSPKFHRRSARPSTPELTPLPPARRERRGSVMSVNVTADAARRFLVARHFLAPARSLAGGLDGVFEVFRKFGSIQFDPIAVAGRNHDLVLHARVADYEPAWCDLLYERREIFEATNKAMSFVPTSEFPWFRHLMGRKGPRFHAAALAENAAVAEHVLERFRAGGPLSTHDFEREEGATKDWFGMPENAVRSVLEAYTVTGILGLARREGNLRYYDLLERLLPAELLAREVPEREQLLHKLLSRYRAQGLLGAGGAGGTFDRIRQPAGAQGAAQRAGRVRCARAGRRRGRARQALRRRRGAPAFAGAAGADAVRRVHRPVRLAAVGHRAAREPVRLRLRVGGLLPAGEAPLGVLRAPDLVRRPLRRTDRAADRP